MARSVSLFAFLAMLVCSEVAGAAISPAGLYIQNQPYRELSTKNPIGPITTVQKASGIVPTVANGLVCWADGRGGEVVIMGYDLTDPANWVNPSMGEFLISAFGDGWQEGNPWAGVGASGVRGVVYDSVQINPAVPPANRDQGDIQGSPLPPAPQWLVQKPGRQLTPISTRYPTGPSSWENCLAWINHPGTPSQQFPGYNDTEIYLRKSSAPSIDIHVTANSPAPREHLGGNGNRLVWQELRYDESNDVTSWDIGVYDIQAATFRYLDGMPATPGKNQIQSDIAGSLLVYTQEEDPAGTKATNIYFQDLASSVGPIAITTQGAAMRPAVSKAIWREGEGSVETYFVVWQDHRTDNTKSFFAGGNGEMDYNWDIWGQEIRYNPNSQQYEQFLDSFLIWSAAGRQTNPDIDGLDVTWQSQAPNVEDIYVWGALVPEPCTIGVLVTGAALLALRRRRPR